MVPQPPGRPAGTCVRQEPAAARINEVATPLPLIALDLTDPVAAGGPWATEA